MIYLSTILRDESCEQICRGVLQFTYVRNDDDDDISNFNHQL